MRHLGRNIAIIAVVLLIAISAIIPPEKNLRLGKDLAGGVSLVYTVDVPEEESPDIVIPQVIRVLQERINPDGLFEISFVRQGRERLVVTMPLPSREVQDLRQTYEDALEALRAYTFDTARFERAMRQSGEQRIGLLEAMMDTQGREALLTGVLESVARVDASRSAYLALERVVELGIYEEGMLIDLEREAAPGGADLAFRVAPSPLDLAERVDDLRAAFLEGGPDAPAPEGFVWRPMVDASIWASDEGERAALEEDAGTYLASIGLIGERWSDTGRVYVLLSDRAGERLTGADGTWALIGAERLTEGTETPTVEVIFGPNGSTLIETLSSAQVGRTLGVLVDGQLHSTPTLMGPIGGAMEIAGLPSALFASDLAETLSEGSIQSLATERLALLQSDAVDAELDLDEARSRALSLRVTPEDMRSALARSDDENTLFDANDNPVTVPSPRARALEALRTQAEAIGALQDFQAVIDAYDAYLAERRGLDDPDDLERLLAGAGVLEFYITATRAEVAASEAELRQRLRERGPGSINIEGYRWAPLNKIIDWVNNDAENLRAVQEDPAAYFATLGHVVEERPEDGQFYMLLTDRPGQRLTQQEGDWSLARSFRGFDDVGRPAINFRMDATGAGLLGNLTGANVGRQMAVLLNGRVYTAPNLISRISNQGQITGSFSEMEIAYIIQTLNAGSLQASLSDRPISRSVLAPELGLDNLNKGLEASVIALILVGVFMVFYYFTSGLVAMIALTCNALIILGAMSLNRAAFTLPGIAGIVLTFGMAVDANVLIYERIREELLAGEDPKAAVRVAYQKVLSTIVDANVTNLIVCVVLAYTASQEIKGFAITLGIGVVATMFSSLLITRVIFSLLIDKLRIAPLGQLPTVIPLIDRLLTPKINWIGLRPVFVFVSAGFIAMGIGFIAIQQEKMLDTEFVGGTQIDLRLKEVDGQSLTLNRQQVSERVAEIATEAEGRIASGDATTDQIATIGWTVTRDGERVSREREMLSDESLRFASTYQDIALWMIGSDAFGDVPAPTLTLEGGGTLQQPIGSGGIVLESDPPGTRADITLTFVNPDALLAELRNAEVVAVDPQPDGVTAERFQIKTSVSDAPLVQRAVVGAFEDVVDSQPALAFNGSELADRRDVSVYPVLYPSMGENFGENAITNDVEPYLGGVLILLDDIAPAPSLATMRERIEYIRRQALYASDALGRSLDVIVLEGTDDAVIRAGVVVSDEGADLRIDQERWEAFAQQEWEIVRTALGEAQTLAGVESFSPEIAATFRNQAIVAVVLSFVLITMYIWARFGSVRYSLAALSCLVHDVIIAIGLIALAEIIYERVPAAAAIGIQPFKIDLGLIAAILTIIGYSLNDTIIILDRIRENRGKLAYASKEVVNRSINQTISRTLITSGTTLVALIVMFVIGGEGIASFTYALICGVLVGTYSSIAVAAPLVYTKKIPQAAQVFHERFGEEEKATGS